MNIIEKNREIMRCRLSKREQIRQENIKETHKQREEELVESEGLEYFCDVFSEKKQEIEQLLDLSSSIVVHDLPAHFNTTGKVIQELQQYVTDSTLFLTEFKIRNCQEIISALQVTLSEQELRLIPKRKFGFKNKKLLAPENQILEKKLVMKSKDVTDLVSDNHFAWESSECGFRSKENEVLILTSEAVNEKDVTLNSIFKCIINITGYPNTLHLSNVHDSTVICGPVTTSIFADNCINSTLVIACQQLRLHSSQNVDVYLHVTSRPILEDSSDIRFAPYNYSYPGLESDFNSAGLHKEINNWNDVGDFNWLSNDQSPNWSVIEESQRIKEWDIIQ